MWSKYTREWWMRKILSWKTLWSLLSIWWSLKRIKSQLDSNYSKSMFKMKIKGVWKLWVGRIQKSMEVKLNFKAALKSLCIRKITSLNRVLTPFRRLHRLQEVLSTSNSNFHLSILRLQAKRLSTWIRVVKGHKNCLATNNRWLATAIFSKSKDKSHN